MKIRKKMKLAEFMKEHGVMATFIARKVGISPQYLHKIKEGKSEPGIKIALKIVDATKGAVTLQDLIIDHVKKGNDDEEADKELVS